MLIMTNKLGRFEFKEPVNLSIAKLIRDTITGQFYAPPSGTQRIKTEIDAYSFIRNHESNHLACVEFGVRFFDQPKSKTV